MELRIAGITKESVVDGPGLRLVIFMQGCLHHCEGCHNPDTHDPMGGEVTDTAKLLEIVNHSKLIRGVTFSGGEPFMQPRPLAYLAKRIRAKGFDIVTYTGFLFEHILAAAVQNKVIYDLLRYTDILVDGEYQADKRDLCLAFRGSTNQRLIDVQASLHKGCVVLWEDPESIRILA